tara:strand:- start:101 stop:286 length:186 start_codon:yes stop_codon:yes gene_type:complete
MTTKLIILGKPGAGLNGKNAFIEVDGVLLDRQMSLDVKFPANDVSTATVTIMLPEIEYRDE